MLPPLSHLLAVCRTCRTCRTCNTCSRCDRLIKALELAMLVLILQRHLNETCLDPDRFVEGDGGPSCCVALTCFQLRLYQDDGLWIAFRGRVIAYRTFLFR